MACDDPRMPPRDSGSAEYPYQHSMEVRFGDTDALGHINNATYLSYFEAARAGYYEALMGTPFNTGQDAARFTFLIAEASVHYRSPGFFGDRVVVDCRIPWAGRSSFGLEYRVRSEGSPSLGPRLLADGETVQVMFDLRAERVTRLPADLRERFEAFEGHSIPTRR
jgi:acyl-CoA thioester hydrolase